MSFTTTAQHFFGLLFNGLPAPTNVPPPKAPVVPSPAQQRALEADPFNSLVLRRAREQNAKRAEVIQERMFGEGARDPNAALLGAIFEVLCKVRRTRPLTEKERQLFHRIRFALGQ